jgi:glycosyltransferase involved in cell wall biosynthesis
MPAKVSAIIPCFNAAPYVGDAIRSALDQTFTDLEVVVVNDGSTDAFHAAVAPYRSRIKIIDKENGGVAEARNTALNASQSDYLAYLDADDRWLPDKIAVQVAALDAQAEVAMVHTSVRYIDAAGTLLPREKTAWFKPAELSVMNLLKHNTITISSVLHRRSAFDGDFFAADVCPCEDWDLWLRFLGRGHRVLHIPEVLTEYRVHGDNASARTDRMLTATVRVMERVLTRTDRGEARDLARRRRQESLRDLGHLAFAAGDLATARARYLQAAPAVRIADLPRVLCTLWPQLARRLWRPVE